LDKAVLTVVIKLLSQSIDIYFDEIGARFKIIIPNVLFYRDSINDPVRIIKKVFKESILFRSKLNRLIISSDFVGDQVYLNISDGDCVSTRLAASS
jgi:hypothetical protein